MEIFSKEDIKEIKRIQKELNEFFYKELHNDIKRLSEEFIKDFERATREISIKFKKSLLDDIESITQIMSNVSNEYGKIYEITKKVVEEEQKRLNQQASTSSTRIQEELDRLKKQQTETATHPQTAREIERAGRTITKQTESLFSKVGSSITGFFRRFTSGIYLQIGYYIANLMGEAAKFIKNLAIDSNQRTREVSKEIQTVLTSSMSSTALTNPLIARGIKLALEENNTLKQWGYNKEAWDAFLTYLRANTNILRSKGFATMAPEEQEQLFKNFAATAVYARDAGLTLRSFTEKAVEYQHKYNMTFEQARDVVLNLIDKEKELNLKTGTLSSAFENISGTMIKYNLTTHEAINLAVKFGKALERGQVSMEDIISYAEGIHKANTGALNYLIERMSEQEGALGKIARNLMEMSQGNPLALEKIVKAALEGNKEVLQNLGMNKDEIERIMNRGMRSIIIDMAREISGGNKFGTLAILERLQDALSVSILPKNASVEMQQKFLDIAEKGTEKQFNVFKENIEEMKKLSAGNSELKGLFNEVTKKIKEIGYDIRKSVEISLRRNKILEDILSVQNAQEMENYIKNMITSLPSGQREQFLMQMLGTPEFHQRLLAFSPMASSNLEMAFSFNITDPMDKALVKKIFQIAQQAHDAQTEEQRHAAITQMRTLVSQYQTKIQKIAEQKSENFRRAFYGAKMRGW